jgi:hypothetical protein
MVIFIAGCGRIEMNHPISVKSAYTNILPPINRDQLPAVVVRTLPESVDASRARQKRACVADTSHQQCLKPLIQDSQESLTPNVIDLEYFRSLFLFPLDYLRGTLIAAYQWAQQLLSVEEDRPSLKVDLYV